MKKDLIRFYTSSFLGLVLFISSFFWDIKRISGDIGMGVFPQYIGGILILMSIFFLIRSRANKDETKIYLSKNTLLFIGLIILFPFVLKIIGMLVSVLIFELLFLFLFKPKSFPVFAAFLIAITVSVYFIFVYGLNVHFDFGLFGF